MTNWDIDIYEAEWIMGALEKIEIAVRQHRYLEAEERRREMERKR